MKFNFPVI